MFGEDEIDRAARGLTVRARLDGPDGLLLLDVIVPEGAPAALAPAMRALAVLHRRIQAEDVIVDIEETLQDSLKDADQRGVDQGCEIYRALLARRLKDEQSGSRDAGSA